MKKIPNLLALPLLLLCSCGGCIVKQDDNVNNEPIELTIPKGESFLGFSMGLDDHTIWISTQDSLGTIHIRKCYEKGGFPLTSDENVTVK